ncbi:hypothetical protein BBJ41_00945 [Burkholderia stabilis]|uniref:UPF0489 family protein n=1 Tax=Burkholderia stabilis TaxID=95485 RepID=UPI0008519A3C|nr:UPF0489 family protein [Burkholderia stabilis]AOR66232.1 hypothetical protein BBJ41_00945 [Burkholderia stabilis]HDR9491961.1 UPF0489 family protein [Burkholderia stabilis]HDR9524005.1 UPF0489 family protein [Burkholderia stabilis]HDR9530688.1 UPF0489 family protein [Burkholderia stabilis]HDR9539418.1 UPF0489 family protein [Burkholderia stabilis]
MAHTKLTIGGKDVYIVRAHHHVLQGWAEVRLTQGQAGAPALLTFDHHTDTHEPFLRYRYWATSQGLHDNTQEKAAMLPGMIAAIDWNNAATVEAAIEKLKHDEHVRTAIQAGIVSRAFVVNLSDETHADVAGHVYSTCSGCASIACQKPIHDDHCVRARADHVIESIHLNHEIDQLNTMAQAAGVPGVEADPYILDIDLDYFHTEKAIEPDDTTTFYRLVQNALAITIATEPACVRELRLSGSKITGKSLLDRMLKHIDTALT